MKTTIDKKNNFDFLRLLFASLVIISHSFPLSGNLPNDPTFYWSQGQINLGTLSVGAFFSISGFLIIGSLNRSKNLPDYFWKRILRLYPGLIVVTILTCIIMVVINPAVTHNRSFWTYLPNILRLYSNQYTVEGIFENNPYKKVVNGSLWTLCYEFSCYIVLVLLIIFRKNMKLQASIVCVTVLLSLYFYNITSQYEFIHLNSKEWFRFSTYFLSGVFLYYFKSFLDHAYFVYIATAILLMGILLQFFDLVFPLISYVVLYIGTKSTSIINQIGEKIGDLSYGVYIYGFIIQQTLMFFFDLNVYSLMISSLVFSLIFGYFSWHCIEKPMLRFKNIL